MHPKDLPAATVSHLVEFVEGLAALPTEQEAGKEIEFGRQVFASHKCGECHNAPAFTSPKVFDVGFKDTAGNRAFNPPSLRGVRVRRAFFHDGRAESLRSVLEDHRHPLGGEMPAEDLQRLLAYLKSL